MLALAKAVYQAEERAFPFPLARTPDGFETETLQYTRLDLAVAAFTCRNDNAGVPVVMEQEKLPAMPECIDEVLAFRCQPVRDVPVDKTRPDGTAPY